MFLKSWMKWIVITMGLSLLLHLAILSYLPYFFTGITIDGIKKRRALQANTLLHNNFRKAGEDAIPMENPDTISTIGYYDLSKQPVRFRATLPSTDNYWSVSLYDWNTDNFFVQNDKQVSNHKMNLVLVKKGGNYQARAGEKVVVSPSNQGIILVRMIASNRLNSLELPELLSSQKQTRLELIKTNDY
jgi:uncharacterized membrane protein